MSGYPCGRRRAIVIPTEQGRRFLAAQGDRVLLVADFAGTFVFAAEGALLAIASGLDIFGVMVLAFATSLGGGVVRDVLLNRVPTILHSDIYAAAAFGGAFVLVAMRRIGLPRMAAGIAGGLVCFLLPIVSAWLQWSLPRAT
jgi:uncharacterized membrane protein YeiH